MIQKITFDNYLEGMPSLDDELIELSGVREYVGDVDEDAGEPDVALHHQIEISAQVRRLARRIRIRFIAAFRGEHQA
jgi:hypothetical protein